MAGVAARGKLVVLDGDPGTGKSTLSLDLAARISTGKPWPDGAAGTDPAPVVLATAEDDLADTVRPRLNAAGGDPSYVHALIGLFTLADVEMIEDEVRKVGAVLVIIDVLAAYLPSGSDAHVDQDVRTVLAPIAAMAKRTRSCVVLVRHLNKSVGGSALYRGGGSIGISGAARAVLLAGRDPEDDKRRVLAPVKANLALMPPALSYQLVAADGSDYAHVEWLGQSKHDAEALVSAPRTEAERDEESELVTMLRMILDDAGGEILAGLAMRKLRDAGLNPAKATLWRARTRAGILTKKTGDFGKGEWTWTYGGARSGDGGAAFEGSISAFRRFRRFRVSEYGDLGDLRRRHRHRRRPGDAPMRRKPLLAVVRTGRPEPDRTSRPRRDPPGSATTNPHPPTVDGLHSETKGDHDGSVRPDPVRHRR